MIYWCWNVETAIVFFFLLCFWSTYLLISHSDMHFSVLNFVSFGSFVFHVWQRISLSVGFFHDRALATVNNIYEELRVEALHIAIDLFGNWHRSSVLLHNFHVEIVAVQKWIVSTRSIELFGLWLRQWVY